MSSAIADRGTGGRLPSLLRNWRQDRNFTIADVARTAGIARSTVGRWERGATLPQVPELEAVLNVLAVPYDERLRALECIPRSRAVTFLAAASDQLAPICGNALLLAMRNRRGIGQDELATLVGVTRGAIGKWERGEAWPSAEHLHQVCFHLGAQPEELFALTRGPGPLSDSNESLLDAFMAEFEGGSRDMLVGSDPLIDLRALALESEAVRAANREGSPGLAHQILGEIRATYAQSLVMMDRKREAGAVAERARTTPRKTKHALYAVRAAIVEAMAASERVPIDLRSRLATLAEMHLAIRSSSPNRWDLSYLTWISATRGDAFGRLGYAELAEKEFGLAGLTQMEQLGPSAELSAWHARVLNQLGFHSRARRLAEDALSGVPLHELIFQAALWLEVARAKLAEYDPDGARLALSNAQRLGAEFHLTRIEADCSVLEGTLPT